MVAASTFDSTLLFPAPDQARIRGFHLERRAESAAIALQGSLQDD